MEGHSKGTDGGNRHHNHHLRRNQMGADRRVANDQRAYNANGVADSARQANAGLRSNSKASSIISASTKGRKGHTLPRCCNAEQ